jgi:glycosyltransferase involved in cell wall biosynthesis
MRVLFLVEQFWPYMGGIQVWAARLLPALVERGWEIVVATSHGPLELPDRDQYKGVQVLRFPFWPSLLSQNVGQVMRVRRQLTDLKASLAPDLIHVNLIGPLAYFHDVTANASRSSTLVSLHNPLQGHGAAPDSLFGRVLRSADWVTAGSKIVLDEARGLVPQIRDRSSLIYYGLDAPALAPLSLPTDPPRLLCVGRLVSDKGFDVAIDAFARVIERFPRARLTIASDGPARPSLEQQVRELGLADTVEFLGWIDFERMPALLNSATVVLVPSRIAEGFGLVALEAALMARPVVATRFGALPEVVADGEAGLLVERDDPGALADAITHLLTHPEAARRMGETGRRRAQALFGLQRHIDSFDALYRELAGRHTRFGVGSPAVVTPTSTA